MCDVTVIRGYYGTKMEIWFGVHKVTTAFDSDAMCVFFFFNEIVIRCFFLEEKSLWCTVKFLYHSQGKGMTNAAM